MNQKRIFSLQEVKHLNYLLFTDTDPCLALGYHSSQSVSQNGVIALTSCKAGLEKKKRKRDWDFSPFVVRQWNELTENTYKGAPGM